MVGLLGLTGWWAFGFGPVHVDTFSFRRFLEKNQKSENGKAKKRGKPKDKKSPQENRKAKKLWKTER
jgi:hypothetical protein